MVPLATLLALGCGGSPEELYERGQASFKQDKLEPAISDLESFVGKSCGPTGVHAHCRQAYLTLGHAYEKREAPGKAWAAYDSALTFGPHSADEAIQSDRDRMRDLLAASKEGDGAAPVIIRYRDEVTEDYTPRSVIISLDFQPVVTKDKDVAELHSPDFRRLYSGSVPAGEHVLVVEMAHDCGPGAGRLRALAGSQGLALQRRRPHPVDDRDSRLRPERRGGQPSRPALDVGSR